MDLSGLVDLFKAFYPTHKSVPAAQDPLQNAARYKLQLRCNKCGARIARWAHRKWGNPYCGTCYEGPAALERLTYPWHFLVRK